MKHAVLLGTVFLIAAGCAPGEDEEDAAIRAALPVRIDSLGRVKLTPRERRTLDLTTAAAHLGALTRSVLRFGTVLARPDDDIRVASPVTGLLEEVLVPLGKTVSEGDLLATIRPLVAAATRADFAARRQELEGRIGAAQDRIRPLASQLERITILTDARLATGVERDRAEAELSGEKVLLNALRRSRDALARPAQSRFQLLAPGAGVVAELRTDVGNRVREGAVIVRLLRPGPRWIDVAVPPGDLPGDGYRVHGPRAIVPGTLLTRGTVIDPDGLRRDRIGAGSTSATGLPPGATVAVDVLHDERGYILPVQAVVRRDSRTIVFVEVEENTFAPRPVNVGPSAGDQIVVSAGLNPGEEVVVQGAAALLGELGFEGAPGQTP